MTTIAKFTFSGYITVDVNDLVLFSYETGEDIEPGTLTLEQIKAGLDSDTYGINLHKTYEATLDGSEEISDLEFEKISE